MRHWFSLTFTPDRAANKPRHYDYVTDILIDDLKINEEDFEVMQLFRGMSPTMQKAVRDIMITTQKDKYIPKGDQV